jgi:hypothetical protein
MERKVGKSLNGGKIRMLRRRRRESRGKIDELDEPLILLLHLHRLPVCFDIHCRINDPRHSPQLRKRFLEDLARELRVDQNLVRLSRRRLLDGVYRRTVQRSNFATERERFWPPRVNGSRDAGGGTGGEEEVGEVAIENDAVSSKPAEEGDGGAQLVDDEDIERFKLAEGGPVGGGGKGGFEGNKKGGKERKVAEVVEERGEEEGEGEVELAEHSADDGEAAEERTRENRVAEDVDFERTCRVDALV